MMDGNPPRAGDRSESIFEGDLPIVTKLERARTELLDLSARNRLLNIPRSSKNVRIIEVVDELTADIFRLLVGEGRTFAFGPGRISSGADLQSDDEVPETEELDQPDDGALDDRSGVTRSAGTRLQTRLTSKSLQRRLLDMYFDARTLEEEQGVNILYLALGTMRWVDPNNAGSTRSAPLVLVPVRLERATAGERFKLKWRQEDPAPNLSLEVYLDRVHALKMPSFEFSDNFDPELYMLSVGDSIKSKVGWSVSPNDVVLGFFSFAKFLMYRDLDPGVWPKENNLVDRRIVRSLLGNGFETTEGISAEDEIADARVPPKELVHIVDSDSSQTLAVHEVRSGRDLIIQGPPGTGKSQTIANIIAAAIKDGKTVLFVAEKMAALEVVKRRLDGAGVGEICLELHSNKADKRAVLDELRRTWELGGPKSSPGEAIFEKLRDARDILNAHAARMHAAGATSGFTPYQVVGHIVRLRDGGQQPTDVTLDGPTKWTAEMFQGRCRAVDELVYRIEDIGLPVSHPWSGVGITAIIATDIDRFSARIERLAADVVRLDTDQAAVAERLGSRPAASMAAFRPIERLAYRIASAPDLDPDGLASKIWLTEMQKIRGLLDSGAKHSALASALAQYVPAKAWSLDFGPPRDVLGTLPPELDDQSFSTLRRIITSLPRVTGDAARLAGELGTRLPPTFSELTSLIEVASRVASAPNASPDAFLSASWERGIEEAADLVKAIHLLAEVRIAIGSIVVDAIWTTDLTAARGILASHGSSFLRGLNSDWRRANRLVRSLLKDPKTQDAKVIPLLDQVIKGQAAAAMITAGEPSEIQLLASTGGATGRM